MEMVRKIVEVETFVCSFTRDELKSACEFLREHTVTPYGMGFCTQFYEVAVEHLKKYYP